MAFLMDKALEMSIKSKALTFYYEYIEQEDEYVNNKELNNVDEKFR